jgi:hypothetical protein
MSTPQCLLDYANKNQLNLVSIRYKHQFRYMKRKGFDLVNPTTDEIIASFEPTDMLDGSKWYLRHVHDNYTGSKYFPRLSKTALKALKPLESSFIHLKRKITKADKHEKSNKYFR